MTERPRHWILTGSLPNFRGTRDHGFGLVGLKEGRRRQAEEMELGDLVAFYVTGVQALWRLAFQGQIRTISEGDMEAIDRALALREAVTR